MALYQLKIAYDGTNFLGFQKQRSGKERTVQAEIETGLHRLGWRGKSILAAGRTDAGVHASGQMIAFQMDWPHSIAELKQALNANLPLEVVVLNAGIAPQGFHPRYSARARKYIYRLYCSSQRDPLRDRYAWKVWPEVKLKQLKEAAALLVGEHDFAAFGKPPKDEAGSVRNVLSAEWHKEKDRYSFEVSANSFLYHMVRRMVFLQVKIGQGLMSLEKLQSALEGAKRIKPGIAPACGLELTEVEYG